MVYISRSRLRTYWVSINTGGNTSNTNKANCQLMKNMNISTARVLMVSFTKLNTPSTNESPMTSKSLVNRDKLTPVGVLS